ncbi:MAG: response regulator, partial [Lachnospiraceae bacterium]|nr:response regulator [Lachnospiraceae bacterium]
DNELNLKVFCNLLKETKVKITPVISGKDCLAIAERRKFHIIFLDHMMPEMDGLEILKRLQGMKDSPNADTPVYVLTANAVAGAKESYIEAGFRGFLSKPIDAKKLEQMILKELPEELVRRSG